MHALGKTGLTLYRQLAYIISVLSYKSILSQDIPLQTVFEVHVSGFTPSLPIFVLLTLIYHA